MTVAAALAGQSPSPFSVFRNRNFTFLWSGQFVSTIGSSLTSLAASILVYRLTGSAASVGLMLMATAVPSIFLGLIAGVFVDRWDRKRIMIGADLARALLVACIPLLVAQNILWLYVIVLVSSAVTQFFDPAHASVLPEVATDEELAAANSFLAISSFGSTAVGFAASGLIASAFSIDLAFYLDAVTFVFSALCVSFVSIRPMAVEEETSVAVVFRNMRRGFQALWSTPILRSILFLVPLVGLSFGLWNSLLLPFARQALNATEFEYGIQEGLTSVGFVAGSLLMARVASRLREGQWLVLSYLSMGVVGLIYARLETIWIAIVMVMVSGFANAPAGIARNLIVQRNTPREARGRINSVFFVTRDVAFLFGMAGAGFADVLGVRLMMVVSAALVLVPGVLSLVLPGLGQPAAEWRRRMMLLRAAPTLTRATGRMATLADLDLLASKVPALVALPARDRKELVSASSVIEAEPGQVIVRRGDEGDAVYFILRGQLVAGIVEQSGAQRALETLQTGDFFGEIAALTGSKRTANVIADSPSTLMEVPAPVFRRVIAVAQLSELVHAKLLQRMMRVSLADLPRFAGTDQETLRDLRQTTAA